MREDYHLPICTNCYAVRVEPVAVTQPRTSRPICLTCREKLARQVKRTVVSMHKSNYMMFTDMEDLKQLNPKRTQ